MFDMLRCIAPGGAGQDDNKHELHSKRAHARGPGAVQEGVVGAQREKKRQIWAFKPGKTRAPELPRGV